MVSQIRDRILDVASDLFYTEGIRAVGIDRVIEEAGIAKATLYRHFPSKEHLIEAHLRRRHERVMEALLSLMSKAVPARDKLAAIFDMLFEKAGVAHFRGCAFALAVGEYGSAERLVDVAREHKACVRQVFQTIASEKGSAGETIASHLSLLYEGALSTVAVDRDPAAVLSAKTFALFIFDNYCGAQAA